MATDYFSLTEKGSSPTEIPGKEIKMKTINQFACKHQKLYFVILALLYIVPTTAIFLLLEIPSALPLILAIELFIVYAHTASAPAFYIREGLDALSNCDPYPLLKEVEELEKMKLGRSQHQNVRLNKAACLLAIGEFEKAKEVIEAVDVDLSIPLAEGKMVYYNNLAAIYEMLGEKALALFLSKKALFIYDCMKEGKAKQNLEFTAGCLKSTICRLNGEYSTALNIASAIVAKTPYQIAQKAYECALAYKELQDVENEKTALYAVVSRTDKLYIGINAKKRLEGI